MNDSTQKFTAPNHTIFGELFIQEQHCDAANHHLLMNASMLEEVLKSLRAALYVRRSG